MTSRTTTNEGIEESTTGSDDFALDGDTVAAVETLAEDSEEALPSVEKFDIDALFEMLVDPGRRYVLTYLLQSEGAVACNELVDYVLERTDYTMTDNEARKRITAKLTRDMLPELDEYGYVHYNMERQMVGPTELTPLVRPHLDLALTYQQAVDADFEA